ncbi:MULTISPECIES: OsmC family protein [Microbacterium]|uniref:OsmC family protein n=1 Tax=Microbacterium TaxID=33882 RepID=UPI001FFCEEA7|nr:OsmC family protein [Microbacterium galbinum]
MAEHATRILGEHRYALTSIWTGNTGTGTSGYRDYRRDVEISVEGKPMLLASADKPFRGDPARWNPEDLLVASLSECHLLSYLHACVTAGVVVLSYRDDATGTMREDGAGGGAFSEVTLHPQVVVADASMIEAAERAHVQANEWCFIANSMNFPVRHEATVTALG